MFNKKQSSAFVLSQLGDNKVSAMKRTTVAVFRSNVKVVLHFLYYVSIYHQPTLSGYK